MYYDNLQRKKCELTRLRMVMVGLREWAREKVGVVTSMDAGMFQRRCAFTGHVLS
jgi:hypothetical protein